MTGGELGSSGIAGIILPFVVSFLKSVKWPRGYKIALTAGLSLVVAIIITAVNNGVDTSVFASWGVIFATASSLYTTLLEKSEIEETLRNSGVK